MSNERALGRCDKRQYEHAGDHQRVGEYGQSMPPFPCVNWKPVASTAAPTKQEGGEDAQLHKDPTHGDSSAVSNISAVLPSARVDRTVASEAGTKTTGA